MMLGLLGGAGGLLSGGSLLKMGFMAASAAGMYLLNGKKEKGEVARLDDTKVSSSAYGKGIPLVYGTMRVTGNMFWATDFEERLRYAHPKGKGDGKKGEKKGTPYYEYHANFAMALCEGPVEEVLRIWADSNLIYDKHNPHNKDIVGPGFSRNEGGGGKSGMGMNKKKGGEGGNSSRFRFRFYNGTEEQMPDPFMVGKQGADLVPAHRGLCYLFFQHFALADFGNRTPTITAEVSVRKKMQPVVTTMENLPLEGTNFVVDSGWVRIDAERYRMFVVERDEVVNDYCMRVYDLSSEKEIRRIYASDIRTANGYPTSGLTRHVIFKGITANGDILISRVSGQNSDLIAFIDYNTLLSKKQFGIGPSASLSNGPNRIVNVSSITPLSYTDVQVSIDGEAEATLTRANLIQSFSGWCYIFSEDYEPLSYFNLPGWANTNISKAVPATSDIFGGMFFLTSHSNTNSSARLLRVKWNLGTGLVGLNVKPLNGVSSPAGVQVVREIVSPGGTNFVSIGGVQYLPGLQKALWFEKLSYTDPLTRGLYAATGDVDEKTFHVNNIQTTRISSSPSVLTPPNSNVPINTSNGTKWFDGSNIWRYDAAADEGSFYSMGNKFPDVRGTYQAYWATRDSIIATARIPSNGNERMWVMILLDRNDQTPVDIHFILSDIGRRIYMPAEKMDFTRLNKHEIMGYIIENPASARRITEDLAQIFMFDVVESDYRLKFVSRGQESIVTVPQRDLAVIDNDTHDYFNEVRSQEIDLPQTVTISYVNAEKDYVTNSQHYRRPRSPMPTMQSSDKLEINLPMAMSKDFAKQLAHKVCMSLWTERINYEVMLPWKYMKYDPTDVMTFVMDDSLTFSTRMMKMDLGANLSIECSGVAQTPAAYTSDANADEDGGVITEPKPFPPLTDAYVLNIPYLDDSDDVGIGNWAYYYGAAAFSPGLRGAAIEYRLEGLQWKFVGLVAQELVWGTVYGTVPPPANGPFATDDKTVITLMPAHAFEDEGGLTYSWESIPENEWPSVNNTIVIGEEIIYFRDAEIQPNGSIKISHLIRGARGTENAAYDHSSLERFCVITDGLQLGEAPFLYANKLWMFRSFSGFTLNPPYRFDIELDAATHKPWGLTDFKRTGTGNITISWERRTRLGGAMVDGTGTVPLNEESENYEIYILDDFYDPDFFDPENPATYVRKLTRSGSTKTVSYTTSMKAADGFTNSMPLHVVGFQVSDHIGRGFPGYATLYPSILT